MLNPEYVDVEDGIVKLGFTNDGEQALEVQIKESDLKQLYELTREHIKLSNFTKLKVLLKTLEGRKQFHLELGDYKYFVSIDDIHKIAPALLFWLQKE